MEGFSQYATARTDQRARTLRLVALGLIGLMLVGVWIDLTSQFASNLWVFYSIALLMGVATWWLARQHKILLGTLISFVAFVAVIALSLVYSDNKSRDLFILLPFVLLLLPMSALLLGSRATLIGTFIGMIVLPLLLIIFPLDANLKITVIGVFLAIGTTGGLTWLSTRQLEHSIHEAEQRSLALMASEQQLQQQAISLQARTAEAELRQQETASAMHKLETAMNERDDLALSLQEATLPVMPVHDQVIVLPLVGSIDSTRAVQLTTTILSNVQRTNARAVIIDVTGVPLIDTQVAGVLLKSAEAVRLLGATTVLVGIRPEVAQTIVGLGLSLNSITVRADLQSGIKAALEMIAIQRN
jgi:rsbT co-antagonist protein RsbR